MHVYKYTEGLQKQLGSKTKPEPWLHCTYSINDDKKGGKYVIFIWDTRQVVEEGELKREQLFTEIGKGRYLKTHVEFKGRPARDNGQPLKGAKNKWQFEKDVAVPQLKIKGIKQRGPVNFYESDDSGEWDVECNINGHRVIFECYARSFWSDTSVDIECAKAMVDGEKYQILKPGANIEYNGRGVFSCDVKISSTGKSNGERGQKYKIGNFANDIIAKFANLMNKKPELISNTFKNAIR